MYIIRWLKNCLPNILRNLLALFIEAVWLKSWLKQIIIFWIFRLLLLLFPLFIFFYACSFWIFDAQNISSFEKLLHNLALVIFGSSFNSYGGWFSVNEVCQSLGYLYVLTVLSCKLNARPKISSIFKFAFDFNFKTNVFKRLNYLLAELVHLLVVYLLLDRHLYRVRSRFSELY